MTEAVEAVVRPLGLSSSNAGLSLLLIVGSPAHAYGLTPDKFAQILGNLLSNSLRYTPPGGRRQGRCPAQDRMVAFVVEDNGVGIPARRPAPRLRKVLPGGQIQVQRERRQRHRPGCSQGAHPADGRLHRARRASWELHPLHLPLAAGVVHRTFTSPPFPRYTVRAYSPSSLRRPTAKASQWTKEGP